MNDPRPPLTVRIADPHGFCAGVERAVEIVDRLLVMHGAPVYVRHEIVHNKYVVDDFRARGVVFIDEIDDIPQADRARPVVFSAHGVAQAVIDRADAENLNYIDATCPLVTKVHMQARHRHRQGYHLLLIGHAGHPEIIGTMGQVPAEVTLVETVEAAEHVAVESPEKLAYLTQTTLSVEETAAIIRVLKRRFPAIIGPSREDICYATTNRQQAVREVATGCEVFWVIGSENSSNAARLVEVAASIGVPARMIESSPHWDDLQPNMVLGLSSGASAPEVLVDQLIAAIGTRYKVTVEHKEITREVVSFNLPRALQPT